MTKAGKQLDGIPRRKSRGSLRLPGWDYGASGWYFITICTMNRRPFFGTIDIGGMDLSPLGIQAHRTWKRIPIHHPHVAINEFVIMPNHLHGVIALHPGAVMRLNLALAEAGLLDGKHYAYEDDAFPEGIYDGTEAVQFGNIITSGTCSRTASYYWLPDATAELTQKLIEAVAP